MKTLAFAFGLLIVLMLTPGCASRPKASESEKLYYQHGGDTLRRKRTETRTVTERVRNAQTGQWEDRSRVVTVSVLEIETADGQIIDWPASIGLANQLREGQPIPTITEDQAAAAGLIGNCVEVTRVVEGGAGHAAGLMEDDLLIEYNGQRVLGTRKLRELCTATEGQEAVTLIYERDGRQRQVSVSGGPLGVEGEDYWRK